MTSFTPSELVPVDRVLNPLYHYQFEARTLVQVGEHPYRQNSSRCLTYCCKSLCKIKYYCIKNIFDANISMQTKLFYVTFSILFLLKGQSNKIFNLQFFSSLNQSGSPINGLKYFSILVEISLRYSNFSVKKSDSLGYHTPGRLPCLGIIPWRVIFWRIFY